MMEFVECPEEGCDALACIAERYVMESTSGPVEMVRLGCVLGHRLNCPAWCLVEAS
jgi:hypothetical protein